MPVAVEAAPAGFQDDLKAASGCCKYWRDAFGPKQEESGVEYVARPDVTLTKRSLIRWSGGEVLR